ncbi:hypothetical protein AB6A40_001587 [Gnathostoma spinigerum]|uniref:Uncharacterized protein n=1 Tax=Gnathostoma spinigerum TaxID=75299 RepID=A0ABD6EDF8_9BILA
MMNTNVDALISSTLNALQKFHASSSTDDAAAVNERLSALVRVTSTVDPTARLSMKNPNLMEVLSYCPSLLSATTTSSMTRSRLHLLLFNLSFYNVNLRRYLAGEKAQLCGPVLECLKLSLKEQLGPQNLIDILRLLQVLTYESCLCLGCWASDLISFLLSEICRPEEPEWMPYCMAILCNLATKSKSVCQRIKKSVRIHMTFF